MTAQSIARRLRMGAVAVGVGLCAAAAQSQGALAAKRVFAPGPQPATAAAAAGPDAPGRGAPHPQELRFGAQAPQVRELQIRLRHAKYLAAYDANDRFGMQTRAAVANFQRDNGLQPSGRVDRPTWDALLAKSLPPTAAELDNTDVGPWFTGPEQRAYMMELQHRLGQIGVYKGELGGELDAPTRQAIGAYRARLGLPASDVMDERTWSNLLRASRNPRYAELFDAPPASTLTQDLDARCATGRVVCISKQQRLMSYVVDGKVQFTREARFARPGWDSPVGEFRVWYMNRDTVSTIFGERTPMPYAIFYSGNVAIHFSQDFADKGYASGSHGCSQLKDYQAAKWLYEHIRVGDRIVVYL
ncbi:MAG TPA: L,D-transpeptidase family protein [Burkholderiaceae bacterium]|nr:L,D-transpeptidase family protein [Burkholderiaceae bacterium]